VITLFLASIAFHHQGNVTHAIRIGEKFHSRPGVAELVRKSKPEIYQEYGFDGQFFYFLAHDPLLLKEATVTALDSPHIRARRIVYPVFSRFFTTHRARIPKGMTLALILSYFGISLLAASMVKSRNAPVLMVFPALVTFSIAVSS
jgi:hypothetical protein